MTAPDKPMTAPPENPSTMSVAGINTVGSDRAPFIYFDGVITQGSGFGMIRLELGAITIVPGSDGHSTRPEYVFTGHLCCNETGALDLKRAIEEALRMAEAQRTHPLDTVEAFSAKAN